ncbi:Glycosyltransferase [Ignavibacterium album JCM 16511]|uniref:Glycosyltransferase n=1 Tax=Ignavibacterium album (strain DSM 19864 / JCM 16511 / NBRC 101810 / Mat9-16) TaxID=945713 RepID=I0AJG1_IGNAJ|nr:glycosyltransferase family 2 protein [Ignavibacterium album]AFH49118.1 Glycosyltransferase [Ignavibacterium album JCM 16511]
MKISIITVTKNNKAGLLRAIESVRSQTYKNVEHVIVDGLSTDGTKEILKQVQNDILRQAQGDEAMFYNLQFISEADSGIYDAINKGIKLATGDVIGLLHSDDFYADEFVLERYAEVFQEKRLKEKEKSNSSFRIPAEVRDLEISPGVYTERSECGRNNKGLTTDNLPPFTKDPQPTIDAVYSDLVYVRNKTKDENREMNNFGKIEHLPLNIEYPVIRTWKTHRKVNSELLIVDSKTTNHYSLITDHLLLNGWMPPHPTLFVRREVFEKYGLYRTDMKIAADYEMILRLFYKYKITSVYLPFTTYCMTIGGASNKSLRNIFIKSSEDYRAMRLHQIPSPIKTLLFKNLRKLPQFFR